MFRNFRLILNAVFVWLLVSLLKWLLAPLSVQKWHELRDQGKLSLAKTEEEEIFHNTAEEHHKKEGH